MADDSVGLKLKYYVLNPNKGTLYGHASRRALCTYADEIEGLNPKLAAGLRSWVYSVEVKLQKEGGA